LACRPGLKAEGVRILYSLWKPLLILDISIHKNKTNNTETTENEKVHFIILFFILHTVFGLLQA